MQRMMLHRHALPALALVLLLPGCTEETIEPLDLNGPPSAVAGAGGDDQSATVGTALPLPLSVQITDEDGEPVPAVGVAWTVSGGTLSAPSDTTDENGASSVIWTMPQTPGDYTATATVPG